jgi:hypothetical protein
MPTTLGACQIYSVGKIEIRKEEIYNTVVVSSSSVIFCLLQRSGETIYAGAKIIKNLTSK